MPFQRDHLILVGRRSRVGGATVVLLAAAALAAPAVGLSASGSAEQVCGDVPSGVQCGPGNARRTAGGGDKVSHRGWPAFILLGSDI